MIEKCYTGRYEDGAYVVTADGKPLDPRLDLANHSPSGFCWGYSGSGPAQLALAVLADAFDDATALRFYQDLKWRFFAQIRQNDDWQLRSEELAYMLGLQAANR